MKIDRHVFGSFKGYTTLARSGGVGPDESRALETACFAFGQTYEPDFAKQLTKRPAYFTRQLRADRRSLTRVLPGQRDDNNRPTLLFVTLVLSQRDWDAVIGGDVGVLLSRSQLWEWDGQNAIAPLEYAPSPQNVSVSRRDLPAVMGLLSELERAYQARRAVIVLAEEFSPDQLRAVEAMLPPSVRPQLTTAYRSLSDKLPVSLNALAPEADARNVNFHASQAAKLSAYGWYLEQNGFTGGAIPYDKINGYKTFGQGADVQVMAADPDPVGAGRSAEVSRRGNKLPIVIAAVAAVVLGLIGFFVGLQVGKSKAVAAIPPPAPKVEPASIVRPVVAAPPATQPITAVTPPPTTVPTKPVVEDDIEVDDKPQPLAKVAGQDKGEPPPPKQRRPDKDRRPRPRPNADEPSDAVAAVPPADLGDALPKPGKNARQEFLKDLSAFLGQIKDTQEIDTSLAGLSQIVDFSSRDERTEGLGKLEDDARRLRMLAEALRDIEAFHKEQTKVNPDKNLLVARRNEIKDAWAKLAAELTDGKQLRVTGLLRESYTRLALSEVKGPAKPATTQANGGQK